MAETDDKEQPQPQGAQPTGQDAESRPDVADGDQAASADAAPGDQGGAPGGGPFPGGLFGEPMLGGSRLFPGSLPGGGPDGSPFPGGLFGGQPTPDFMPDIAQKAGAQPAPAPAPHLPSAQPGPVLHDTVFYDTDNHADSGQTNLFASLYDKQWALHNTMYSGVDLNILTAWEEFTGEGVVVSVIDDGVEYTHPDIGANYVAAWGYDAGTLTDDPWPKTAHDNHGTTCASLMIAPNDGIGITGVAYDASLEFSRINFDNQDGWDAMLADAAHHITEADVLSMSYGTQEFYRLGAEKTAYLDLATNGRDGLGVALFQSTGNERTMNGLGGYSEFGAQPYVNHVAAITPTGEYAFFSTPSASTLITAPGTDIWVADRVPDNGFAPTAAYVLFMGTSYSCPIAAGVAALMYEANPDLGYRDVQTILAMTARQLDTAVDDPTLPWTWQVNGADNVNGGGMHVSHDYGFGLVDATAAVRLAESWDQGAHTQANVETLTGSATPGTVMADVGSITSTISMGSDFLVEYGLVNLTISGGSPSELVVTLTSPEGTTSWFLNHFPEAWEAGFSYTFNTSDTFPFGTTQVKGENALGDWTLTVEDTETGAVHTLDSWSLTLYGETGDDNDLYVYTNEYSDWVAEDASRSTLTDTAGTDTLNASAVTASSYIDLSGATASSVDGTPLLFGGGTVVENVHTGDGNDTIIGNDADNQLFGWRGDDVLSGGNGNDLLFGGTGSDQLTGGAGSDIFRYQGADEGNDFVLDFSHADDYFSFDFSAFGQSAAGTLTADRFFGTQGDIDVTDACFVYEADILWYDADGNGGQAAVIIAQVSGDDVLADDIHFV